jgi:plastocyanin
MMRSPLRSRVAAGLAPALVIALVGGCFSERPTGAGPTGPVAGDCSIAVDSPVIGSTGALVAVRGFAFQPDSIVVAPGTRVTWINCETTGIDPHTSTSNAGVWESPFLPPGATYSFTFPAAGRFDYHCVPHPFMHGVVIVR